MYPHNYTTYKIPLQTALKIVPIENEFIHHSFVIPYNKITKPCINFKIVAYEDDENMFYYGKDITLRNYDIHFFDSEKYVQCHIVQNPSNYDWHININTNVNLYLNFIELSSDVFDYKLNWFYPNNPDNIIPDNPPTTPPPPEPVPPQHEIRKNTIIDDL
jgi:hypothetical protein